MKVLVRRNDLLFFGGNGMHIIDIIKKKRDGGKLTKDEIEFL